MRELIVPTILALIQPEVKIRKCNMCVPKLEASTRHLPSKFEFLESAEDSCVTPTLELWPKQAHTNLAAKGKGSIII